MTIKPNFVKAIYKLRGYYGYNLETSEAGKLEDATRLYQASYANADNKTTASFKVNIKNITSDDEDLIGCTTENNDKFGNVNRVNSIIYIDDVDKNAATPAATYAKKAWDKFSNIAIKNGDTYVCNQLRLSESKTRGFYVPKTFTSTSTTYDRKIEKNYVAVCLPFAFNAKNIGAQAYKFKDIRTNDNGKAIRLDLMEDQIVAANTPCFLVFDNPSGSAVFEKMPGTKIIPTEEIDLSFEDNTFGNYGAKQTYEDLQDASKAGAFIYGIQGGEFVLMNEKSQMHAFRSFMALDEKIVKTSEGGETTARFSISLLDEDGNEEVTGIELVSTANNTASDFKVVGGRNAIDITTGKACDVKVYTLNGALAKTARVEAGTTTLPMNAGMYVVNKAKVIVK